MRKPKSPSFLNYIIGRIDFYKELGNEPRAKRYQVALDKFRKFMNGKDCSFDDLTRDRMEMWEEWLRKDGICPNTISYYNRILRTLYNKAVDDEIIQDTKPFKKCYTGNEKTLKRAIPIAKVKQLAHIDLSDKGKTMEFAHDMFMLSFYTRGMSWIDLVTLKKTDIQQGVIVYRRHKTGQKLYIKIEKPMKVLFEKYWDDDSDYLLNIIKSKDESGARREAKNALFRINKALHELGKLIGVQNLTMYVARHSWASACKASNIPISVISEGMGHDSEETTRIYLAQLDTSVVDKANRKIINQIV